MRLVMHSATIASGVCRAVIARSNRFLTPSSSTISSRSIETKAWNTIKRNMYQIPVEEIRILTIDFPLCEKSPSFRRADKNASGLTHVSSVGIYCTYIKLIELQNIDLYLSLPVWNLSGPLLQTTRVFPLIQICWSSNALYRVFSAFHGTSVGAVGRYRK